MYSIALVLAALAFLYFFLFHSNDAEEAAQDEDAYLLEAISPNDRYRVVGSESDGAVVLKHTDTGVLWEKPLQRPQGLSVSNDGTVVVENWGSSNPEYTSELFAFDRQGEKLLEEGYDALVRDSGIAEDGTLAWFATANAAASSEHGDGNQLFVYDLDERTRLLKTDPPVMEIERVEKSDDVIEVITDGLPCRYKDGEMINAESFQWAKEERELDEASSPNTIASVAKRRVERADQLTEDQIRSTIEAARKFDGSGSDRTWAKLWGRKGELHHHLGETEQALDDYEKALSLDDRVGVKQKAERLRKELGEYSERR